MHLATACTADWDLSSQDYDVSPADDFVPSSGDEWSGGEESSEADEFIPSSAGDLSGDELSELNDDEEEAARQALLVCLVRAITDAAPAFSSNDTQATAAHVLDVALAGTQATLVTDRDVAGIAACCIVGILRLLVLRAAKKLIASDLNSFTHHEDMQIMLLARLALEDIMQYEQYKNHILDEHILPSIIDSAALQVFSAAEKWTALLASNTDLEAQVHMATLEQENRTLERRNMSVDQRAKGVLEWIANEDEMRDMKTALASGAAEIRLAKRKRFSETWDDWQRYNAQETQLRCQRQRLNARWQMREPVGFFGCEGLIGTQKPLASAAITPPELVSLSLRHVDAPAPYRRLS